MAIKKNPVESQQRRLVAIIGGIPYFTDETVDQSRVLPDSTLCGIPFAVGFPGSAQTRPTAATNVIVGNFGVFQF